MKEHTTNKKGNALLTSKIKSARPKLFPEGVLGYFIGPVLALVANSFLASYFNKYITDIYNITAWAALFNTLLPIVSVIFVILGNILVGRLMDRHKTKVGKARPLILLSLPLSLLALMVLFIFAPFANQDSSQATKITALVLIAVGYNLWFAVAYPLYFTPHSSLVNLSTRSGKDRSLLATLSNACNLASIGLCTMIIPFFLSLLFKYDMTGGANTLPVYDANGKLQYYTDLNGGVLYDTNASLTAWKIFAIILLVVTFIGVVIEFYFTRERVTEESLFLQDSKNKEETKKNVTVKEQWSICRKDKYWIIIIIFFFLYQFGGMIKNVSQLYYSTAWFQDANGHYTTENGGALSGTLAIIGAIPTALGMFIAWPLSNKIGKKKAILFGALVSVIGGAIGFLVPVVPENTKFAITAASFAIKALGTTPAMYLSIALLGDVLDHQEALYGQRTDGLSMTIYGSIMAGMTGIVTGILNGVLSLSGYTPNKPEVTKDAILWLFIGGETICYAVIIVLFIFMDVEKFSKLDHQAIENDQKAKCQKLGIEYVSSQERLEREEELANQKAEEARIHELKEKCEKKGLDFETEEKKYQDKLSLKNKKKNKKTKNAKENKKEELDENPKVVERFEQLRHKTESERIKNLNL